MSANDIDKYGLIALYAANFDFDEMTVRRLIDSISDDACGDVDEGVDCFVYGAFCDDMLEDIRKYGCRSFDGYVRMIRFPYDEEAFTEYLRGVWDEASDLL